jgi:hypothetical protein
MLEFEKTYPILRVYFNSKASFPWVWSVDDGNQNNEMLTPNVVGQGVHQYEYNGQEANPIHPVAWIEYRDARIHRVDDSENFFIENSSE